MLEGEGRTVARKKTPRWLEAARRRQGAVLPGGRADWLARALGRAGVMPLAEAERAIREGRVEVEGRVEREPFAPVHPGMEVRVDGQVRSLEAAFETSEWGFAIAAEFWGTGVFHEAARLVVDFTFSTLGATRLEARAALRNGRGNGAPSRARSRRSCDQGPGTSAHPRLHRGAAADRGRVFRRQAMRPRHRGADSCHRDLHGGRAAPLLGGRSDADRGHRHRARPSARRRSRQAIRLRVGTIQQRIDSLADDR